MELLNDKVIKRFFDKVEIPEENLFACWEWTGGSKRGEYGMIGIKYKMLLAHRVSYLIWNKKFPEHFACHTCDNPSCVNPLHLWDGTNKENMTDMSAKGRKAKGQEQARATLTTEQVREIVARYSLDRQLSYNKIGKLYGVCGNTIFLVLKRKTYKNI